jgi:acyl-CoA synthetase (AMP-forming)/AMP-acid ligase II/aryl carrier-like protein
VPSPQHPLPAPDAIAIAEVLAALASADPSAPALRGEGDAVLDRAGLRDQVDLLDTALTAAGLPRGARIGLVLPDSPLMATTVLGVMTHRSCAPVNPRYTAGEIAFVLRDIGAAAVVVHDDPTTLGHTAAVEAATELGCRVLRVCPVDDVGRATLVTGAGASGETTAPTPADDSEIPAILLHTSGTTARPKLVGLRHEALLLSARAVASSLQLTSADRSLAVMPLFHVHGIVAALLAPLISGGEVAVPSGHTPGDIGRLVTDLGPTWITAVPSMLQALVEQVERTADGPRHRLRAVRSCSSALPPALAARLETALGVPVVEAYGMTEAAHQIASNPLPPATRKVGSVGVATGPEIAVHDAGGRPLPTGEVGEVVLRGPSVITAYVENPAADAAAFTNGWFHTGDLGYLDADGYLVLVGRSKEMINRAGEKIAPREVEDVLLDHPAVTAAAVFSVPDRRLGEQVAAAVVLRSPATEQELRIHVSRSLAPFKVPRRVVTCTSIPVGPTGKVQRHTLAAAFGLTDLDEVHERHAPRAPAGPVEQLLAELWSTVLDAPVTDAHATFIEAGGDSLRAARLLARLRDELDLEVTFVELFDAPTIAQQAELVARLLRADG